LVPCISYWQKNSPPPFPYTWKPGEYLSSELFSLILIKFLINSGWKLNSWTWKMKNLPASNFLPPKMKISRFLDGKCKFLVPELKIIEKWKVLIKNNSKSEFRNRGLWPKPKLFLKMHSQRSHTITSSSLQTRCFIVVFCINCFDSCFLFVSVILLFLFVVIFTYVFPTHKLEPGEVLGKLGVTWECYCMRSLRKSFLKKVLVSARGHDFGFTFYSLS